MSKKYNSIKDIVIEHLPAISDEYFNLNDIIDVEKIVKKISESILENLSDNNGMANHK